MNKNFYDNGTRDNSTPTPEQQIQQLVVELRGANAQMYANNQNLWSAVNARLEQDARMRRKERKKGTVAWVTPLKDRLSYVQNFNDGSQKILDFTLNLVPDFKIRKLAFNLLCKTTNYVGIYFQTADFWIIDRETDFNGKRLRRAFVKNNVIFNAELSEAKVEKLLESFFLPRISSAREVIIIPALAGWDAHVYMTKEKLPFRHSEGLPSLPICDKSMTEYEESQICPEKYFKKIRDISHWRLRTWLMVFPFAGILSSVLDKEGVRLNHYFNLVCLQDVPIRNVSDFFQLFNRHRLEVKDLKQEEIIVMKDEVLLLDARKDERYSDYVNKKRISWCKGTAGKILRREFVTEDGYRVCIPIITISDSIARSRYAMNIFVDEDFAMSDMSYEGDVNGMVYSHIVRFCEQRYGENIRSIIKAKQNNLDDPEAAWLEAVCNIADKFWTEQGVNMREMANIPYQISWQELAGDSLLLQDDVVDDFVTIMRKGVENFVVREKRYGKGNAEEISYDEEWLYVPTAILNRILSEFNIESNRKFLVEMREQGYLKVDNMTSLSRQIQVGKLKVEMYQIQRKIFNRPGLPDIIDLGKEVEDV